MYTHIGSEPSDLTARRDYFAFAAYNRSSVNARLSLVRLEDHPSVALRPGVRVYIKNQLRKQVLLRVRVCVCMCAGVHIYSARAYAYDNI